jgi:hypothetical protein
MICLRTAAELAVAAAVIYACWHWLGQLAAAVISVVAFVMIHIRESSAALDMMVAPRPPKRGFADTQPLAPPRAESWLPPSVVQSEWHIDPEGCVMVDDPLLHPKGVYAEERSPANEDGRRTA